MSRLITATFASLASFTAVAHDGHGATPAHVHVEGLPVDLGLIALTIAAMAPLVVRAWRARVSR
jgi:hypothetical protein